MLQRYVSLASRITTRDGLFTFDDGFKWDVISRLAYTPHSGNTNLNSSCRSRLCRTELNSIVPLGVWKASGYALPACLREVGRVKTGWMNEGYCWFCSCFSYAAVIGFLTHTAVRVECHFIISTPQMQTRFQMPCGSGANNPVFICAQLNTDSILILIFLGRG